MTIKLIDVRGAFFDLWEAVEFKTGDGKFRYNASFIIKPDSIAHRLIEAAISEAALKAYGTKWEKTLAALRPQSNKFCYVSGDLKDYAGYAGNMVLTAHRRKQDGPVGVYGNVIDPQTGKVAVLPNGCGRPYAGCYVNATVDIYAQSGENPGIRCGLSAVQFARDGDAFTGSKPSTPDDFEALEEGADADSVV